MVSAHALAYRNRSLKSVEKAAIKATMFACGGEIKRAAAILGIAGSTLRFKLKTYEQEALVELSRTIDQRQQEE